jgi:hypothetical protein
LTIRGPWVIGALINNVWSFAGDGDRKAVNQMLLQPFVTQIPGRLVRKLWPMITADWEAHGSDRWTVPSAVGWAGSSGSVRCRWPRIWAPYDNVVRPDNGAEWQLRARVQFLFPR